MAHLPDVDMVVEPYRSGGAMGEGDSLIGATVFDGRERRAVASGDSGLVL